MPVRMADAVIQFASDKALSLREGALFDQDASGDAGGFETDLFEVGGRLSH